MPKWSTCCISVVFACSAVTVQAAEYDLVPFSVWPLVAADLDGGVWFDANEGGDFAIGTFQGWPQQQTRLYFYRRGQLPLELPRRPGMTNGFVVDMNDSGQMIVHWSGYDVGEDFYLFDPVTGRHPLLFPSDASYFATDLNNNGEYVGAADIEDRRLPWYSDAGGNVHFLQNPTGSAEVVSINDSGRIVGTAWTLDTTYLAIWPNRHSAPTLIPQPTGNFRLRAITQSETDYIGVEMGVNGWIKGFMWHPATGFVDMGSYGMPWSKGVRPTTIFNDGTAVCRYTRIDVIGGIVGGCGVWKPAIGVRPLFELIAAPYSGYSSADPGPAMGNDRFVVSLYLHDESLNFLAVPGR